jgi:hypothetical protein
MASAGGRSLRPAIAPSMVEGRGCVPRPRSSGRTCARATPGPPRSRRRLRRCGRRRASEPTRSGSRR